MNIIINGKYASMQQGTALSVGGSEQGNVPLLIFAVRRLRWNRHVSATRRSLFTQRSGPAVCSCRLRSVQKPSGYSDTGPKKTPNKRAMMVDD